MVQKVYQTRYEDVLIEVSQRDSFDKKRVHSPLKKAKDSLEVDVSNKSVDQIFEYLIRIIQRKIKGVN